MSLNVTNSSCLCFTESLSKISRCFWFSAVCYVPKCDFLLCWFEFHSISYMSELTFLSVIEILSYSLCFCSILSPYLVKNVTLSYMSMYTFLYFSLFFFLLGLHGFPKSAFQFPSLVFCVSNMLLYTAVFQV